MNSWQDVFNELQKKPFFWPMMEKINNAYENDVCYPPKSLIFNAFKLTPFNEVKVVLIGQDPYHQEGQAMGLAFSVPKGIKLPPSLKNIYREIEDDLHIKMQKSGDLTYLANQGVLLLNTKLTVKANTPLSHNFPEYKVLLKEILNALNLLKRPIVYILWGNEAKVLQKHLNNPKQLVITGGHPSPLSANRGCFFGGRYFSRTNEFLVKNKLSPIVWQN